MASPLGTPVHAVRSATAKIGASAEVLAFGAQHDGAHLRRAVVSLQHIGDFRHHVGIDEVVRPAPDLDRGHDAGLRDADMLVACHVPRPCSSADVRCMRPYAAVGTEEMAMARLDRDGVAIHYEVHGRGPAILLSHGYSATCRMWDGQIEALRDRFQVIVWDMRGHGRSDYPSDPAAYSE